MNRRQLAETISEVGGPAPLLLVGVLQVGLSAGAVAGTVVAALTMGVVPYAVTLWLARAGAVTDRFVGDRRQRTLVLAGTLALFIGGATTVLLMGAPGPLRWLVLVATAGLALTTAITVVWKVSIHATLGAFFAGIQLLLLGVWGLYGILVLAGVVWARRALQAHTIAQLAAGVLLGAGLAGGYGALLGGAG